jgi:hypothetical protein
MARYKNSAEACLLQKSRHLRPLGRMFLLQRLQAADIVFVHL